MDLQTFVAESLRQIVEGIREAQKSDGGGSINAQMYAAGTGHLMAGGTSGMFTRVDFDVAVSAETSGGGKANLTVFGVGASGGGEHKQGYANRISFSVPGRLPDGNKVQRGSTSQVASEYEPLE